MSSAESGTGRRRRSPETTRPSWFWPLAGVVVPVVSAFAKIRVSHPEKLPTEGAYVLAPNHYSEIDPVIVAVAVWRLGRAPRFMAKDSLFRVPVLGWALRVTGMIPVARQSSSSSAKQTLSASAQLVQNGQGVIVYPEGTLTRDPGLWPMRGKTGAVRLALQGGIPLIPVAHWGAEKIMPRYGKKISLFPRKEVRMLIGDPVDLSDLAGREHEASALNEGTTRLMDAITVLLEQLRDEKAPAERWNPSAHNQSETGRYDA